MLLFLNSCSFLTLEVRWVALRSPPLKFPNVRKRLLLHSTNGTCAHRVPLAILFRGRKQKEYHDFVTPNMVSLSLQIDVRFDVGLRFYFFLLFISVLSPIHDFTAVARRRMVQI